MAHIWMHPVTICVVGLRYSPHPHVVDVLARGIGFVQQTLYVLRLFLLQNRANYNTRTDDHITEYQRVTVIMHLFVYAVLVFFCAFG